MKKGSDITESRQERINQLARIAGINLPDGKRVPVSLTYITGIGDTSAKTICEAGKGKAKEVPEAIRKATEQAKRQLIRVPLREGRTLHHDVNERN